LNVKQIGCPLRLLPSRLVIGLAGFGALAALSVAPALAADDFNDWSCKELYAERNGIYKDAGYCFKTAKAIEKFGNAGCSFDDINDVPLSPNQRKVVKRMRQAERAKGC
jgi:YARHG domain